MKKEIVTQAEKDEVSSKLNEYQRELGVEKREELAVLIGFGKEALSKWVSRGSISPEGKIKIKDALEKKRIKDEHEEFTVDVPRIYELWIKECELKSIKELAKFLGVDIKYLEKWEVEKEIPDKFIKKYKIEKLTKYKDDKNIHKDMKAYSLQEIEIYGTFFEKMEARGEKEIAEDILDKYSIDYEDIEECSFLHYIYDTDINDNHVRGARGIKIRFSLPLRKQEKNKEVLQANTISIPKLSITASCGSTSHLEGIDSFETQGNIIIDADTLKVSNGTLKAIKVEGNSMVPTLLPESWVVFNEHGDYVGEGLYVLNWRNILMVKLLQINAEGKLRIISVNKDYESYTLNPDDQSIFRIIGKVVRVIM